jgi:uncharacterized protein YyaL (SSP411 family)
MIRSLLRYARNVSLLSLKGSSAYLTYDAMRYFHGEASFQNIHKASREDREKALTLVVEWLLNAQQAMKDNGVGSYHLANGWGSSYPETTGYIIPSLINYGVETDNEKYSLAAKHAANFLLSIQKPSGGWQGGRMNEDKPEIVFNTAQVLRGMIAVYLQTGEEKYLAAATKGADWISEVQHPEGYWKDHALMSQARVYDSYVDAPLLSLFNITGKQRYRDAAVKNLQWIIDQKMHANGWFEDCDNTVKHNDRPILHTIAYTLDGLLESDELLRDGRYLSAARTGAEELKRQLLEKERLYGRYDKNWSGSEYFLCTGSAQMAIVWLRLFGHSGDMTYLEAADMVLDILIYVQRRNFREKKDTIGAVPGSFPIWGRYEPFAFPNWASKFFADALMMRMQIDN